jgi:hypothetical protein
MGSLKVECPDAGQGLREQTERNPKKKKPAIQGKARPEARGNLKGL